MKIIYFINSLKRHPKLNVDSQHSPSPTMTGYPNVREEVIDEHTWTRSDEGKVK